MRHKPTEQEGKESLISHASEKAWEARQAYGRETIGLSREALDVFLADRKFVRYPVALNFDATALEAGEFAYPQPIAETDPTQGFTLHVHPNFAANDPDLSLLVAYQIVAINYGEIASHEAAEAFGSMLCGMEVEAYYQKVCQLADSLKATEGGC